MKNLLKYINNQSSKNYDPGNKIIFNTEVLKPNLFNCDDACKR